MTESNYERIAALIDSGSIEEATRALEAALHQEPNSPRAAYLLGVCYFRSQRFDAAESMLRRSISQNTQDHLAHYYLGLSLERQHRKDEAVVEYRIALAIKPDLEEARQKLEADQTDIEANPPANETPSADATLARRIERAGADELSGPDRLIAGDLLLEGHPRLRSFSILFVLSWVAAAAPIYFILFVLTDENYYDGEKPLFFISLPWLLITGWLLLSSRVTKYWVHERRIDFQSGVLFRKRNSLWLYQIEDIWLTRSPFNLITADSSVQLRSGNQASPGRKPGQFRVTGIGNSKKMQEFFEELRDSAIVERRAMKNIWV